MLKITKAKRLQTLRRITRIQRKNWTVDGWMYANLCQYCCYRKHRCVCEDVCDMYEHYYEDDRLECTWCHGREGGCMYCGDYSDDGYSDNGSIGYDVPSHSPSYVVMTPHDHALVKSGKYPTCQHCSRSLLGQVVIAERFCSKTCYLDEQELLEDD
jgi:hypothetical protein